ncbi:hypothetical protein ACQCWA_22820 [Rossellomorea aquimaris]|jgi:hypothetical protein|uniref:hypothetical protein n=1 Tax=Bacillaceae TaxID=186817 RepID=UPI0011F07D07|nr:hypothetical protein [Bacillus sp. CH30_1T]KAA0566527.1 hypothetical protein F0342_00265 [Bacillus sp. CH30_1T]
MTMDYAGMLFAFGMILLFTVVGVVIVTQFFKNSRAKSMNSREIARDEEYRKLAEESILVQKKMSEDLTDLRERVASMEKMIREVE